MRLLCTLILLLLTGLLAGCQSATVAQPLTAKLSGNDPDSQLEFWHTLADRHVTSNDEAFHGLLLYLDNSDPAADYAGRVAALKSRKLIPANFDAPANQAVTRGVLAYAILEVLHLKGGWVLHVFHSSPHYAVRELESEGVYPPSTENQTFSGAEFLGIIGKVEDYQGNSVAANAK
ncbi:MAG TPA: hypothetical protein VFE47_31215 [Tepidisphaeraceae bacterium]|jgi:hypothetical protein|nr:hypothetical protein [Tepidisphaeraceae bacterium]